MCVSVTKCLPYSGQNSTVHTYTINTSNGQNYTVHTYTLHNSTRHNSSIYMYTYTIHNSTGQNSTVHSYTIGRDDHSYHLVPSRGNHSYHPSIWQRPPHLLPWYQAEKTTACTPVSGRYNHSYCPSIKKRRPQLPPQQMSMEGGTWDGNGNYLSCHCPESLSQVIGTSQLCLA